MSFSTLAATFVTFALALTLAAPAHAALKTQEIEYEHGGQKLLGYLAYDDSAQGKRPGVVVVHSQRDPAHPAYLLTVYGHGYKFTEGQHGA